MIKQILNKKFIITFAVIFIVILWPYLMFAEQTSVYNTWTGMLFTDFVITVYTSCRICKIKLSDEMMRNIEILIIFSVPVLLAIGATTGFTIYTIYNFWIISGVYFFLITVFGDIFIPAVISSVFFTISALAGQYLFLVKGNVIRFADLYALKTALTVVGGYGFKIDGFMYCSALLGIYTVVLSRKFCLKRTLKYMFDKDIWIKSKIRRRIAAGILCVIFGFSALMCVASDHSKKWYSYYEDNYFGTVFNIASDYFNSCLETPEEYSADKAEKILCRYTDDVSSDRQPNIIVIMSESFADLSDFTDVAREDYMPFISSLKENTLRGETVVSGYSGGTANSEFEFLTGLTMTFLPHGSYPYMQYIKDDIETFVTKLPGDVYKKNYIHPFTASNYDRNRVYKHLGFDIFEDDYCFVHGIDYEQRMNDYNEGDMMDFTSRIHLGNYGDTDTVRYYISDKATVENTIRHFENKSNDERIFDFVITMQNHSPYDSRDEDENVYEKITDSNPELNQYLYLLKESDRAVEELITYFSNVSEDTVVLFFGDHQPLHKAFGIESANDGHVYVMGEDMDDGLFYEKNKETLETLFTTPFFVWTNFETDSEEIDYVSTNYLSVVMKKYAGLNLSQYEKLLDECMAAYPVISPNGIMDSEGNYYQVEDKADDALIKDYKTVQYYLLFGKEGA